MPVFAPLYVTVELSLESGPAAGERRFRLSHRVQLPPTLCFAKPLPLEGAEKGQVRFFLPDRPQAVVAQATLFFDPQRPEQGSTAELVGLGPEETQAIEQYIEQRMVP